MRTPPLTVAKTLILAGAGDVDGGTVTRPAAPPCLRTVSLDANGDLLYTPNGNANGPDVRHLHPVRRPGRHHHRHIQRRRLGGE